MEESPEAPASTEVRQLMDLLRTLARTVGFSNAALARKARLRARGSAGDRP